MTETAGQLVQHPPSTTFAQISVAIHVMNLINKDKGTKVGVDQLKGYVSSKNRKFATDTLSELDTLMKEALKEDENYQFKCDGTLFKKFKDFLRSGVVDNLIAELHKRINDKEDEDDMGSGSKLLLEMAENTLSQYVGDQSDRWLRKACGGLTGEELRLLL
jgi:hypothetical protein